MITGVILARNEVDNIVECIQSLRPHVSQLFLIDMESEDATVELARPLVDQIFPHPHIANFDSARNIIGAEGPNDWFWFLDADERVPEQTGVLVNQVIREQGDQFEAINIPFMTYFCGRWIQHSGWWPGYTMPRVLKKGHFRFSERLHGGVEVDGREVRFPADEHLAIEHYSYQSIEHYLEKLNRYTSTESRQMLAEGRTSSWEDGLRHMMHDLWLYYEHNQGQQDEAHGWVLAWLSGQYRWLQHAKLLDLDECYDGGQPNHLDDALNVMEDELARLRGRVSRPQLPLGIVWRSPLWDASGYAEEGRTLVKALAGGDRSLAVEEIPWSHSRCGIEQGDAALLRALERGRRPRHSLTITECITTLVEPDPRSAINVLRTTFETDRIPEAWMASLDRFDEIWVMSRHNYEAFRRSGVPAEKLRIVPSCLDVGRFANPASSHSLSAGLQGRFVFLSIFDWQLRKGWDVLLRAWCRAFSSHDPVGLLLKITRNHGHSLEQVHQQAEQCLAEIGHSLHDHPEIVISDEACNSDGIVALYHAADAFVLPSRGEGWGRPYMEAMAAELAIIATDGSGQIDFLNDANCYLIPATQIPVPQEAVAEIPTYAGHRWLEPDEGQLVQLLQDAWQNEEVRTQKARQATEDVRSKWDLPAGREAIEAAVANVERRLVPAQPPEIRSGQTKVMWEGEFFAGHSFSSINEQLAHEFISADELALSLNRIFHNPPVQQQALHGRSIEPYFGRPLGAEPDVTVRHAFPPNWEPPPGKSIHIQPWEFGHVPLPWVAPLRDHVDEIWAPSTYVKRVYERSGIPSHKIQVIPWGVDSQVFSPDATPLLLPTEKSFVFLFVGGTLHRKGIDTLLEAYQAEFSRTDDVCLYIKDMGTQSYYRYGNYREQILRAQSDPSYPEIIYIEDHLTAGQLASLYTACDVLAMPYRGEGFGLPILEAMACGRPVIVPEGGASDDFVTAEAGYLLSSQEVETKHEWPLAGPAMELQVSVADLRSAMRRAWEDRDDTRQRGRRAAEQARHFTWEKTARRMTERIQAVAHGRPQPDPVPPVTACILTRDCEQLLPECLAHLTPFVDQVLVLDSHSRDRTVALAREYGAVVEEECALQQRDQRLQGKRLDWLFWLQPSDVLDEVDAREIRSLLEAQSPRVSQVTMQRSNGRSLQFVRANGSHTQEVSP